MAVVLNAIVVEMTCEDTLCAKQKRKESAAEELATAIIAPERASSSGFRSDSGWRCHVPLGFTHEIGDELDYGPQILKIEG